MARFLIGVDGGGTGTRAVVADLRGRILGHGAAGPSGLALGIDAAWMAVRDAVAEALTDAGQQAIPQETTIGLGLAGANHVPWAEAFLAGAGEYAQAVLESDGFIALLAAHGGGAGLLLAVGCLPGGGMNPFGFSTCMYQPAAPTILTVTTNYGQVSLTWSAVAAATSYNVKRATTSGAETAIATTASTSYTDTNIVNGTKYYYAVTAVANGVESFNSAEVIATPPIPPMPAPPSGTVLVDFDGQGDARPSPDASGIFWNNVATVESSVGGSILPLNGSSQPMPLVNTTNGNSGWTLAINQLGPYGFNANSAPDTDGWGGPYPAVVAGFPQRALAYGFTIGGPISVTLSGLDSGTAYNLVIYGGNTEWNQGIQTNTLTLGTSPSPAINSFNAKGNDTTAVGWTNITPGTGGTIAFTITPAGAGALNFMELTPNTQKPVTW